LKRDIYKGAFPFGLGIDAAILAHNSQLLQSAARWGDAPHLATSHVLIKWSPDPCS